MTREELANALEHRDYLPECFTGSMIGITQAEIDEIVAALRSTSDPQYEIIETVAAHSGKTDAREWAFIPVSWLYPGDECVIRRKVTTPQESK